MVFKVSQSKVNTYRRCKKAYHYRYVEKLRRKRISRPLTFGKLVHQMIELNVNKKDPFDALNQAEKDIGKVFKAERDSYLAIIDDAETIMSAYLDYWENDPLEYVRKKRSASEHEFEILIDDGLVWTGKIDALGVTPNKLRWLVEHKSFTREPSDDDRWRNLQSSTYIRANDILGWEPLDGTCWDYIRSKTPGVPQMLTSGKLSSKAIVTLPSVYEQAVEDAGLNLADYAKPLAKIEADQEKWFFRVHTPVGKDVVDELFGDFTRVAKEMRDQGTKHQDRSIGQHCGWCDYEGLCRARMQGLDYDFVKEREYETSKYTPDAGREKRLHTAELKRPARPRREGRIKAAQLGTVRKKRNRKNNTRR